MSITNNGMTGKDKYFKFNSCLKNNSHVSAVIKDTKILKFPMLLITEWSNLA